MLYQPTCGGRRVKQKLKSQFLLVNFYFVLARFQIKRALFSLVFPTYIKFCTQIVVLFLEPFQKPTFLSRLEKLAHIISSSLSTVFQVINNISTSTIEESFNIHQKKYQFSNRHQTIELLCDQSDY